MTTPALPAADQQNQLVDQFVNRATPEWVMVGAKGPDLPHHDGSTTTAVALIASKTLTEAELKHHVRWDYDSFEHMRATFIDRKRVTLTAQLKDYVVIIAPTYAEALAALLKTWSPDQPANEQEAIEA